jgi:hypothetical protein
VSSLLRRLVGRSALVRIEQALWTELVDELARRGMGLRESGAFLLASKTGDRRVVTRLVYFDDLDPQALNGGIHLRSFAFSRLWRICREEKLAVVCDIHTHPGTWVGQSGIDKDNPMISREGHIGIILPDLARGSRAARDAGVHIYHASGEWEEHLEGDAERLLYIGHFA